MADLLRRVLEYNGYSVKLVMNITDVGHLEGDVDEGEDKLVKAASKRKLSAWQIAAKHTDEFVADLKHLNIEQPYKLPKATDHIDEQISLIRELEAKGFTYRISDGIYFDTAKFPKYHEFTGQKLEEKDAGARVEVNKEKHRPEDFALWKFSAPDSNREMEWDSPWGKGFPGWHIECSAMSTKYLGQPFDIHTGGADLAQTHHPNEVAQSEAATGELLANYWLHAAFMNVDGTKMSKSLGNVYVVQDLVDRGYSPLSFRLMCLMTSFRKPLNFTWEGLKSAETALKKLKQIARSLPIEGETVPEELELEFKQKVNDDLGLAQGLSFFWEQLRSDLSSSVKTQIVKNWDQVFGLDLAKDLGQGIEIPSEIKGLLEKRDKLREAKEFNQADQIRKQIESLGFEVKDTEKGSQAEPKMEPTILG